MVVPFGDLLSRWCSTCADAGATAAQSDVETAGADLLRRWSEPHRHYHDVRHLTDVLRRVDELGDVARDVPAVRLAAWFHDAVYDCRPGDDEEASAALAERTLPALGVPQRRVVEVARLVRSTAGHDPEAGDVDTQVLCDADLAILASDSQRYAEYVGGIRAEYAAVPDELFRAGRAAVLRALVEAPSVFRTAQGRKRWEDAARANIAAELHRLSNRSM